ncbi:MAG: hypothetical protein AAGJ93_05000, partial [Bacteroidota bacterium]
MKRFICSLLASLILTISYSQEAEGALISGEILVYFTPEATPASVLTEWSARAGYGGRAIAPVHYAKRLGIRHNIHLLRHNLEQENSQRFLQLLQQHTQIVSAQFN